MSITREYLRLSKEYQNKFGENTILFMMVGKFYEVYAILEEDKASAKYAINVNIQNAKQILTFVNTCDFAIGKKTTTEINCSMAGFPELYLDKYIKKMQDIGYTVVVYNQVGTGKNITRQLTGIFSPGTYFAEDSISLNNNTTCIWAEYIENKGLNNLSKGKYLVVGIANINVYTGKTTISQFQEPFIDNPTTYDNLERFISIYNPSEVIIISNLDAKYIQNMIQYTNIQSAKKHIILLEDSKSINAKRAKECEKKVVQEEILRRMFHFHDFPQFIQLFYGNHVSQNSFCYLLDFISQHNPHLLKNIEEPEFENCSERLILANHSLKQLHIIPENGSKGKYSSVSNMLNCCLTSMGKRKFNDALLSPITNAILLQKEYDMTSAILNEYEFFQSILYKPLATIKDLNKFSRQLYISKISPKHFYQIVDNISTIKEIYIAIQQNYRYQGKTTSPIEDYMRFHDIQFENIPSFCDTITDFIERHLDLPLCKNLDQMDSHFINSGVNGDLDDQANSLLHSTKSLELMKEYFNSLISETEKKSAEFVKYHITEKYNYSLVCTSRRAKLLNDKFPLNEKIIQLSEEDNRFTIKISKKQFEYRKQTATNIQIYDPQINSLCSNIQQTNASMKDIILQVYRQFVEDFQQFKVEFDQITQFITLIDVLFTKAHIAHKYNYCKPEINLSAPKSFVDASHLRHCIIEQIQQDEELYVSNDISLGLEKDDGMLLYGTNAVGKTSLIRSLGIAVIMAQAGLFVPCSSFVFKPYEYIFTRILGNDNIFKGLSTFAVEMSELRTILRLGNENSLILGDELCSGTEIVSAISIFVAGIQHLAKVGGSFIFATHLHEIVEYEEVKEMLATNLSIQHLEVIYDKEKDMLIYDRKLKDGPGNSLYGLEVCKSLALADEFIESAYAIRNKYHNHDHKIKVSHFNAKKAMGMCEKCGVKPAEEVHHLQHQQEANKDGFIKKKDMLFHKNKKANLFSLCGDCHDAFHSSGKQHKKVKTSKGTILMEI